MEKGPGQDSHRSIRAMAAKAGLSQSTGSRIWWALGLKPHVVETWKLSTDPDFIDKIRDVVSLYLAPPANAAVFAVDEKPQVQACLSSIRLCSSRHGRVRESGTCGNAVLDLRYPDNQAMDLSQPVLPMTTPGTASPACSPPSTSPTAL